MLTNGTRYFFRVAAANEVGNGDWSATIEATPAWKPGTPTGLTAAVAPAEGVGSGQVKLTWNAPVDDGGADITDYIIQFRKVGAVGWFGKNDGESADTTSVVGGFTNGTPYRFRVSAVQRGAVVGGPGYRQHRPRDAERARPGGDGGGGAGGGGRLRRGEADLDGGGGRTGRPITDYLVERSVDGATWTAVDDGVSTATTSTVGGLTNGRQVHRSGWPP